MRRMILPTALALGSFSFALAASQPPDQAPPLNAEALLIVFPDYPITTDYGYLTVVGHAGVLLIDATGTTKYFEFGRYHGNMNGEVQPRGVSNVIIDQNGKATEASLKKVLVELSTKAGQKGRIRAAYFINMDFGKMLAQAKASQPDYDIVSFNCGKYAERVILSGNPNVDVPTILNPVPNNIVDEYIEESNAEVTFDPATGQLHIGDSDESDAKE